MKKTLNILNTLSFATVACMLGGSVFAAPATNSRASSNTTVRADDATVNSDVVNRSAKTVLSAPVSNRTESDTKIINRGTTTATSSSRVNATAARSATTSNVSRSATLNVSRSAVTPNTSRAAVNPNVSRSATTNISRSATAPNSARSATTPNVSRATAIYSDVSAIGGGYAACSTSYNTCMDQFCAVANDTYRRCFCSSKITDFRNTEAALDEARDLLVQFQDTNLSAVDKTAAEVNAMYTATIGESAIKDDVSGAQETLSMIGDLLSGRTPATNNNTSTSLGVLDLSFTDFSVNIDDVFGGSDGGLFGNNDSAPNLSEMEGQELYTQAHNNCIELTRGNCDSDAVMTMASSAYGILITQDCNLYEKSIDTKKQAVETAVADAERILREARLEEYQSNNSADVNECMTAVKEAITTDVACGEDYYRCLDYTGRYMSITTGEPIYSPMLFELVESINLYADGDILQNNTEFNAFLEDKKMFAETALGTCTDISELVWTEFKRTAMIEIAQAQDAAIEEIKSTCISTIGECYDTQTGAMLDLNTVSSSTADLAGIYAAEALCVDKVSACAALYGSPSNHETCNFDTQGRLTNASACGLTALVSFIDTVNEVKVSEGCATIINEYTEELCGTNTGDSYGYPWGCRNRELGAVDNIAELANVTASSTNGEVAANSITGMLALKAVQACSDPSVETQNFAALPMDIQNQVVALIDYIQIELDYQLNETCENMNGLWATSQLSNYNEFEDGTTMNTFYSSVYATGKTDVATSWGVCLENTTFVQCDAQGATYDATTDSCVFDDDWYQTRCEMLPAAFWRDGFCYSAN